MGCGSDGPGDCGQDLPLGSVSVVVFCRYQHAGAACEGAVFGYLGCANRHGSPVSGHKTGHAASEVVADVMASRTHRRAASEPPLKATTGVCFVFCHFPSCAVNIANFSTPPHSPRYFLGYDIPGVHSPK